MIDLLLITLGILGLLIGTITDFQRREVADWVNFSMIAAGLGIRLLFAITNQDVFFFVIPLLWIGAVWLFGIGMYYAGQWGGGDAKMLMGMGALFGTYPFAHDKIPAVFNTQHNIMFMGHVFVNIAIVGALYGLAWAIFLGLKNRKTFSKKFRELSKDNKLILKIFIGVGAVIVVSSFFLQERILQNLGMLIGILIGIFPYVHIASKSVEECMIRFMSTSELTEGEWIVDEITHKGKYITGPKELGITNEQIELFKKYKIKGAKVKVGIPFVPVFFIATIVTMILGNLLLYLI